MLNRSNFDIPASSAPAWKLLIKILQVISDHQRQYATGQRHDRHRLKGVRGLPLLHGHGLEGVEGRRRRVVPEPGPAQREDGPADVAACPGRSTLGARRARIQRHLPLFQWSNPSLNDHLALFTHGVVGQWTIPQRTSQDYVEQMSAELCEERKDSRGRIKVLWVQKRRDNHYLDCELMIDAAALI